MKIQFIPAIALVASGALLYSSVSLIGEHWESMPEVSAQTPDLGEGKAAGAVLPGGPGRDPAPRVARGFAAREENETGVRTVNSPRWVSQPAALVGWPQSRVPRVPAPGEQWRADIGEGRAFGIALMDWSGGDRSENRQEE